MFARASTFFSRIVRGRVVVVLFVLCFGSGCSRCGVLLGRLVRLYCGAYPIHCWAVWVACWVSAGVLFVILRASVLCFVSFVDVRLGAAYIWGLVTIRHY